MMLHSEKELHWQSVPAQEAIRVRVLTVTFISGLTTHKLPNGRTVEGRVSPATISAIHSLFIKGNCMRRSLAQRIRKTGPMYSVMKADNNGRIVAALEMKKPRVSFR